MFKSNKGISLTTAVMTVLILLIVMSTLTYSAVSNVQIKQLNELYNDIRALNDAVAVYFLEHNKLPVSSATADKYTVSSGSVPENLKGVVVKEATFSSSSDLVNPNDISSSGGSATYYKINLDLLNVTLKNADGTYIINEESHSIYYLDGVSIDDKKYYSLPIDYLDIGYTYKNPVTAIAVNDVFIPSNGVTLSLGDFVTLKSNQNNNGVAKSISYSNISGENAENYLTLKNGKITTKETDAVNTEFSTIVTATNYEDSLVGNQQATLKIYLTGLKILDNDVEIEELNLSKDEVKELNIEKLGRAGQLTLVSNVEEGNGISASVDNETNKLTITALNGGTTKLTVIESNGRAAKTLTINVYDPKVDKEKLEFSSLDKKENVELKVGNNFQVNEEKGNRVEWNSTNSDIVKVSGSDLKAEVTAVGFGIADVECRVFLNGNIIKIISIPVKVMGVKIVGNEDNTMVIEEGKTSMKKLNYTVNSSVLRDDNRSVRDVTWTSADESIVAVSKNSDGGCTVTANSVGTVKLTLSVELDDGTKFEDSCEIVVNSKI